MRPLLDDAEKHDLAIGEPLLHGCSDNAGDTGRAQHCRARLGAVELDHEVLIAPNRHEQTVGVAGALDDPGRIAAAQAGALKAGMGVEIGRSHCRTLAYRPAPRQHRRLGAIASSPPGRGRSTLGETVAQSLSRRKPGPADPLLLPPRDRPRLFAGEAFNIARVNSQRLLPQALAVLILLLLSLASSPEAGAADYREGLAPPGIPAAAFPAPSRPVAGIVTDTWRDEPSRDRAGEAEQVMRLLGVKPGLDVADIGAGSGYYTVRLARRVGPPDMSMPRMSYPNISTGWPGGSPAKGSPTGSPWCAASRMTRGSRRGRSTSPSSSICITRSRSPTACCGIYSRHCVRAPGSQSSMRARRPVRTALHPTFCAASWLPSAIAGPGSTTSKRTLISRSSKPARPAERRHLDRRAGHGAPPRGRRRSPTGQLRGGRPGRA